MDKINTDYLQRCLDTLKKSYELIKTTKEGSIEYEMYRNSLVKGFEMTLEQSGKLLRKKLLPYFSGKKEVDKLTFKDLFRYANKHSLITEEMTERWMKYRDNRNDTAHDYGVEFAAKTLSLINSFVQDVEFLKGVMPELPYPLELASSGVWHSTEEKINVLKNLGIKKFSFCQTLIKNPMYTNEEPEEVSEGYKSGGYVAIIAEK